MPATTSSLFTVIYLFSYLLGSALGVAVYVFTAIALFKMAKACGLERPWLSFIPVANVFLMGQIADAYCRRNEGKKTAYRKTLLGLNIANLALSVIVCIVAIVMVVMVILEVATAPMQDTAPTPIIVTTLVMLALCFIMLAVLAVYMVFYYIALHKVFKLFDPANATLFLVLCIFFTVAQPIILMILRQKEPVFLDTAEEPDAGYTPVFSSDYSL